MTRDDIIRMAREACFDRAGSGDWVCTTTEIKRFAALVAAAEREACAEMCDEWPRGRDDNDLLAAAIRARGEKQ